MTQLQMSVDFVSKTPPQAGLLGFSTGGDSIAGNVTQPVCQEQAAKTRWKLKKDRKTVSLWGRMLTNHKRHLQKKKKKHKT